MLCSSAVSIENITSDVENLNRGMNLIKQEYEARQPNPPVSVVNFVTDHRDKVTKLTCDAKTAQESFEKVVGFFGETPKTISPDQFFSIILRFIREFKVSAPSSLLIMKKEGSNSVRMLDFFNFHFFCRKRWPIISSGRNWSAPRIWRPKRRKTEDRSAGVDARRM